MWKCDGNGKLGSFLHPNPSCMLRKNNDRPLIPYDPNFIWVETKEGGYFRRKRGTVKVAELNATLKKYQKAFSKISPIAGRLKDWLKPYTHKLDTGRLHAKLTAALVKSFLETNIIKFTYLKDYEFQKAHPFSRIHAGYPVDVMADAVRIKLPVKDYSVEKISEPVTGYYYELIVVAGDLMSEFPLYRNSVRSQQYEFEKEYEDCELEIMLPGNGEPWMVMVKMNTMEGKELAVNPRHYAMRVVAVGE